MSGKKRRCSGGGFFERAAAAIAFALSATAPASPLLAQPIAAQTSPLQEIELGQPRSGAFPVTAPDVSELPHDDYRLSLEQGQTVRITMNSPATADAASGFDTYLELRLLGQQEPLRTDDDSGDGLNSRIVFTAPSGGTYVIRARPLGSLDGSQNRTYTLLVDELPPAPPPQEFPGSRAEGDLGRGSPEDESYDVVRYAAYWFQGQTGERVRFEMNSTGQGPSLQILNEAGEVLNSSIAYGSNRVQVITVLRRAGRYLVRAQVPASQTAHYTLDLARAMTPRPGSVEEIEAGGSDSGQFALESNANARADGSGQIEFFYQLYELDVREGEPVTAIVTAVGFQPILEAGTRGVLGFVPALTSNPTGEGLAQLVINPFMSGQVVLRLRTPTLEVGSYELRVVPGVPGSQ